MPDNVTISEDYRSLTVPQNQLVLGCVGDAWVRRVYFTAPRYCDDTDLSGYDFYVDFENAGGVNDVYEVEDATASENEITFSWLVSPIACEIVGNTNVSIVAANVDSETGDVLNRFVTTTFKWQVLPSTQFDDAELIEAESYVETKIAEWQAEIDAAIAQCEELQTLTYSGSGESVTAASASYLDKLTVYGKSVQSGTPTPSAPVDVQVVGGRNLLNMPTWSEILAAPSCNNYQNYAINLEPNTTYYLSTVYADGGNPKNGGYALVSPDVSNSGWKSIAHASQGAINGSITTNNDGVLYINVNMSQAQYEYVLQYARPQLEKGSTATPYVPYGCIGLQIGSTVVPIDMQGNVLASLPDGTRDVLGVDSAGHCVLTKRTGTITFNGSETWYAGGNSGKRYSSKINDMLPETSNSTLVNAYCNRFQRASNNGTWTASAPGFSIEMELTPPALFIAPDSSLANDVSAFKSWLASNQTTVVYPLATPTTIDLGTIDPPAIPSGSSLSIDATLTPTINAEWWSEHAAPIPEALQAYRVDIDTTNANDSSIAPVETSTATANHSVGSLIMLDGDLYKVTSAIATGETVVPGTNCTKTTVAAELAALA